MSQHLRCIHLEIFKSPNFHIYSRYWQQLGSLSYALSVAFALSLSWPASAIFLPMASMLVFAGSKVAVKVLVFSLHSALVTPSILATFSIRALHMSQLPETLSVSVFGFAAKALLFEVNTNAKTAMMAIFTNVFILF